jgi:competence protein ComEA
MQHVRSRLARAAAACLILTLALLSAPVPCAAAPSGSKAAPAAGERIDINSASAEQLVVIPGIGKVMADRIIQFREEHGPFSKVEELLKIKGIGEKSLEKLRPYIKIGKNG